MFEIKTGFGFPIKFQVTEKNIEIGAETTKLCFNKKYQNSIELFYSLQGT